MTTKPQEILPDELPAVLKEVAEQLIKLAEATSAIYFQVQSLEERINIIDERTR